MAEQIEHRDFFISFNSADLVYAAAIDATLRKEGFTTFYYPRDLPPGGNIPVWMDDALMNSTQTLALYSPAYTSDTAIYSKAERYATWWQDPGGDKRKLIPVLIRQTALTPLMEMIPRIEVTGLAPMHAAIEIVRQLRAPNETQARGVWRRMQPLPKVFRAPYRPNPNFSGRFEALEALHRALRGNTAVAVTAVYGMGGIGKTTLAAEYCHRFGGQYGGVWTIRAEEPSVMLADLETLGQRLDLTRRDDPSDNARTTLDHLSNLTEPWLLVYDNVPNPDAVRDWLAAGAVRCVITSRYTEFGDVANITRLDFWSEQTTVDYLLSRTRRADGAGATRLAGQLGGLPLAAEQAAAYLSLRSGISFDDYTQEIASLIKQPRPAGAEGHYPDTVYAAFAKSLEMLRQTEPGNTALEVLQLYACLSEHGVGDTLDTVQQYEPILPASLASALSDRFAREDALAALTSMSLLRREDDVEGVALTFHRLLLEVARDWMGRDSRAFWRAIAEKLFDALCPTVVMY